MASRRRPRFVQKANLRSFFERTFAFQMTATASGAFMYTQVDMLIKRTALHQRACVTTLDTR
jgi:hypothetical protein